MAALVSEVLSGSIAEELEIEAGDELLSIDGVKPRDMIDYKFMMATEELTIEILKKDGEVEEIELEKDFDEDLGIVFESAVFDKIKPCLNRCIFCFVDQQPKGLRKTLYIKDDDYRLSYLQGTYITLTNFTEEDKKRIKSMSLGPFYVSVHTTNPELRVQMLRNPNAAKIMDELKWFKKNDIPFHAQIVLCPGFND
jgi:putative radical SAM enzyme (TIGR03279 family)